MAAIVVEVAALGDPTLDGFLSEPSRIPKIISPADGDSPLERMTLLARRRELELLAAERGRPVDRSRRSTMGSRTTTRS